jgi:hypothetical protein
MPKLVRRSVAGALVLFGILALTACGAGLPGVAGPTATPNVQTILQRVQQAKYNDATFTLNFTGSFSGTTSTGTGNGKITKNPERADISLTLSVSGQQITVESITDKATNAAYTKISGLDLPGFDGSKWTKTDLGSSSSSLFDTSQITDFSKDLKNLKLVGNDTVDGTKVWHITGTSTAGGQNSTIDMYVTQDGNYYPKKVVVTSTGSAAGTFTLDFTSFNTGITISLPPADQVQNG